MADMANDLSKNSRVYDRLSFRLYDCHCPRLDPEWLLSTLFDASLLSTSKAAGNGGSFFARAAFRCSRGRCSRAVLQRPHRLETINGLVAGLFDPHAQ